MAPFLVFEDADLEAAVEWLMGSRFHASGQSCVCANRTLLHSSLTVRFTALLTSCVTYVLTRAYPTLRPELLIIILHYFFV